jgi:predicted dehydrogenase
LRATDVADARADRLPPLTIVGAGELVASSYLPAAATLGWKTVLVDRDADRARRLAQRYRSIVREVRSSVREVALSSPGAVVIATPARTHAGLGLETMEEGFCRILLEKPPTTDWSEYEELAGAADAVGATIRTSFLRRGWHSFKAARARFDGWVAAFGPLRRVSLLQGSPWGWKSVATRERGSEGLEEVLLEELPHGFDCLFYIAGWEPPVQHEILNADTTPWGFRGSVRGDFGNGELRLEIAVSRTHVLANAIALDFEGATVDVELMPAGGICIRPRGEPQQLIEGPSTLSSVAQQFAQILQGGLISSTAGETSPALSEWEGPLTLIAGFRAVLADGEPSGGVR